MSWRSVKLGDTCDVIAGGTPKRSKPSYWSGDIPWVKISDMIEGRIRQTEEAITRAGLEGSSAKLLPPGTLLVSIFATIGRTAVLECEAATNQAIVGVIPRQQGQFDDRFLQYSLRRKTQELQRQGRGVAQANISGSMLKATELLVPPLAEQKRIAGILDAADALRAKRCEALAELDTLIQSTFLDMFGDPVTNPMGWEVTTVSTIGSIQGGLQVTSKRRSLPIERPYLRVANVFRGLLQLDEIKTIRLTESELLRTALEYEDILIVEGHGNKAEIGRCARWDGSIDQCVHQNHLIRLRCDRSKTSPIYVEHFINSTGGRRSLVGTSRTTSGLNTISVSKVGGSEIQLPSLDLQHRFAAIVESVEHQKARQRAHLSELDTLFASLQSRAFQGDI